ncbi:hypothetical protein L6J37_00375 [Photobacterium sp. WH77]|uniref:hypothetical protein n=1 Tax=unclassified Photobacterium TaxID=2628852 RepID=UPI001EDB0B47|nr:MULTISPECIES: hypothetical protein [unclassified Photobacterium]MCG2835319.1 hypothetical protein [Photobacterium sp. WH77]MCG2842932.1 hypothetical protein [Photobacterium sp. WH80]
MVKKGYFGDGRNVVFSGECWGIGQSQLLGVFCKRKAQVFQPHYQVSFDTETGVVRTSQYSDSEITWGLKGVAIAGKVIITRLHEWRISMQAPNRLLLGFL